jgi:hypothetical protein
MMEPSPYGVLRQPPSDPYELAKLKVLYHEHALRRAEDQFASMKDRLRRTTEAAAMHGEPPPPPERVEQLRELQKVVRQRRRTLANFRRELEAVIPEKHRRLDDFKAANRLNSNRVLKEIGDIKL